MKDKVDGILKQIFIKIDAALCMQTQLDIKLKTVNDIKQQTQHQITNIFDEIRNRLSIKERELIQLTNINTDDICRKINESFKKIYCRHASLVCISESFKNSIDYSDPNKLFLFWQDNSRNLISDLEEIEKTPLILSFDDNNLQINKFLIEDIYKLINEINFNHQNYQ